jgi:subtilisin family serine protease
MALFFTTAISVVGDMNKINNQELESIPIPQSNEFPNDTNFSYQWSLHNTGQNYMWQPRYPPAYGTPDADIDAPEAWELETGSSDLVIAIIDTGIDYYHPDLAGNIWTNEDEIPDNGIDDDSNGYIDDVYGWDFVNDNNNILDYTGHGTTVAGVVGAVSNNNLGMAGICWDCKIMAIEAFPYAYPFVPADVMAVSEAIKYAADNGADIISMSMGTHDLNSSLKDAVDYAYNKGIVLCASAGNSNLSAERYPAAFDNVIGVAATDSNDNRMEYTYPSGVVAISNYGPWVDVAAPGTEIYTLTPTYFHFYNYYGGAKDYEYMTGTSYAAPTVAGLAGLIRSRNYLLGPDDIKSIICENVDPYDSTYDLGSGRINAFIVGKITNLDIGENTITFNAKRVLCIWSNPFEISFYKSNEKFIVSNEYTGYIGSRFINGCFTATVV